jgi:hypothetical protein
LIIEKWTFQIPEERRPELQRTMGQKTIRFG